MIGKKVNSVVVIGAGVTGLNTAYHLVRKGVECVTVIDKGTVGSGSSLQSGGIVTCLLGDEPAVLARSRSIDLFENYDRTLDGYNFHQVGCLNLLDGESFERNRSTRDMQKRLDARLMVLRGKELIDRFPDLNAFDDDYGVLDLRGGYSEPHHFVPALRCYLEKEGVEFRENEPVVGFDIKGNKLFGVVTDKSTLKVDAAVCAVNAWANHLLSLVGFKIPYKNFIHERFVTEPFSQAPRIPALNDNLQMGYMRPTEDNRLLLGTTSHDPESYEMLDANFEVSMLEPDSEALSLLKDQFVKRAPMLENATWDYHTVGLISFAADAKPVIGPVPGISNFYVGTNFHSGGFGYSPVSGQFLAEFVVDGQTSIDTEMFKPSRFDNFDAEEFLSRSMTHEEITRQHFEAFGQQIRH